VCVGGCGWRVEIFFKCTSFFVDEIRRGAVSSVRIPVVCSEWWLGVDDTTVQLVVGMVLNVALEQGAAVCGSETGVRPGGWGRVWKILDFAVGDGVVIIRWLCVEASLKM
jgi:hypothetical protein